MLNISTVTKALHNQLLNDATLSTIAKKIDRAGYVNKAHESMPWVGIYRSKADFEPSAFGKHASSFAVKIAVVIVLQVFDFKSAIRAEKNLEELISAVTDAIWADPTIGNTVDMTTGFGLEYSYKEAESKTVYEQWASLTVHLEARTG